MKHPSKPPITQRQVSYLKTNLKKILKVGTEFEFNLKENKNNICKNKSSKYCPCTYVDEDCWEMCVKHTECSALKLRSTCENKTDGCENNECTTCGNFKFKCIGIACSHFESICPQCDSYECSCDACFLRHDDTDDPNVARSKIINTLKPTNTYGVINKHCVHSIVTDGSLLGQKGVEIITTGRRIDYWEFYRMAKTIIDTALKNGAYVNERCSIHMHLLASYYGNISGSAISSSPNKISELEHPIPQIVLANFHQLCRKYQNAMTWMMIGLNDSNRLTRWEKFRVSIMEVSALTHTMSEVKERVSHNSGGNKYGWLNYNYTNFDPQGNISRFHVEFRGCDGILCPSAVASIACMYYCLMIKAVEISRFGILTLNDEEWVSKALIVKSRLLNNMKGYGEGDRFSDTSELYRYYDYLRDEGIDLIQQLKHQLIKLGPSYSILEKLATNPIGLRMSKGETWQEIEQDLAVKTTPEGEFGALLSEYIDLRLISKCNCMDNWTKEVALSIEKDETVDADLKASVEFNIKQFIKDKQDFGELLWSKAIGAPVLL